MLLRAAFTALLLLVGGVSAGELGFPPVDLNVNQDSSLAVSFTHPLVFHGEPADEAEAFWFTVSTDVRDFNGSCTKDDDCKIDKVPFPDGAEKCVTLKGRLAGRRVRETERVCLSLVSPENVTLSCQNVNVSVSWEHSGHSSFRVQVGGSAGRHLVDETTEHRYDLSRFVWASEPRYLGFHWVTVTAKEGGNQSESRTTETFSFNSVTPADVKCKLDFPTVDLKENESGATLSFMNPLRLYKELQEAAIVQFTASSNDSDAPGDCTAKDKVCKQDISFPEGAEKCVKTLRGVLLVDPSGVSQMSFRETGPICASSSTDTDSITLMLILLLSVFVVVVIVIIIAVVKAKAWTMQTLQTLPKPVIVDLLQRHKDLRYAAVSREDISPVTLITDKPCKNPSVSTEEEEEDRGGTRALEGGCTAPPYAEGGFSEDSVDDSEKTETVSLEEEKEEEEKMVEVEEEKEEEEEVSPYDCPHTLQVDMGDGDMVTAYSKRT